MQARASQVGGDGPYASSHGKRPPRNRFRVTPRGKATGGLAEASKLGIIGWYCVLVTKKRQKRIRMAAAWLCLLAVALLYAPLAGAALLANGVDCCAGGFCPIAEHHHHKQQPSPKQAPAASDCGHEMRGMKTCSMSCCKDPSRPALIPGAFVLPAADFVPAADELLQTVPLTNLLEISRFVKPLSPPPRFESPVL